VYQKHEIVLMVESEAEKNCMVARYGVFVFSVFVSGFENRARVQHAVTMHCCMMSFRLCTQLHMHTDDVARQ